MCVCVCVCVTKSANKHIHGKGKRVIHKPGNSQGRQQSIKNKVKVQRSKHEGKVTWKLGNMEELNIQSPAKTESMFAPFKIILM